MRNWMASIAAFLLVFITGVQVASAEKKVALVVGNGAYKQTIDLPNAPNDAREVANALRRLGFLVVEGIDLTHGGMQDKLREFARALVGADLGLFYYAGHGLQVAGENYLVPINAELKREADLEFEAVKVDLIMRQLSREAKVKVVILDSCRDNPLAQELARSMASSPQSRSRSTHITAGMGAMDAQSVSGSLIAFATAPGMVALDGTGNHSPFTQALLQHLETPDLDIDLMMKRVRGQVVRSTNERQQPWTNSSLTAEYYLKPTRQRVAGLPPGTNDASSVAAPPPAPAASAPAFDPRQIEFELWRTVQQSNTASDYNAYLQKYPTGTFADIARNRVAGLTAGAGSSPAAGQSSRASAPAAATSTATGLAGEVLTAEASQSTEDALELGTSGWREVQRKLTALGFSTRGTDGRVGNGTRSALREWQQSKQLPATGFLNGMQHHALLADGGSTSRSVTTRDEPVQAASPRRRNVASSQRQQAPAPRRNRGGGESARSNAPNAGAVLGAVLAVGAGVALARGIRRR